jgi:hypothetical protein
MKQFRVAIVTNSQALAGAVKVSCAVDRERESILRIFTII